MWCKAFTTTLVKKWRRCYSESYEYKAIHYCLYRGIYTNSTMKNYSSYAITVFADTSFLQDNKTLSGFFTTNYNWLNITLLLVLLYALSLALYFINLSKLIQVSSIFTLICGCLPLSIFLYISLILGSRPFKIVK